MNDVLKNLLNTIYPKTNQIATKLISKFLDPPNPNECKDRTWNTGGDLMDYKQITKNDIKLVFQIVTNSFSN